MQKNEDILEDIFQKGMRDNVPNISKENALYLRNMIQSRKSQNILEIGTAHGYSTLNFAYELQSIGGQVTSIEFSKVAYEIAREHIKKSGLSHLITQYFWDAREIIPTLDEHFDFVFIDGLKKASLDFFSITWPKVTLWGVVVVDDVIKFRYKMESLYEYLETHSIPYDIEQIDKDDGIMIIEKREL